MKMTDADARSLSAALSPHAASLWSKATCEVHRLGDEAPIFVLAKDPAQLRATVDAVAAIVRPWVQRFTDTDFTIGLDAVIDGKLFTLDFILPEEVREGMGDRLLGRYPVEGDWDSSVFAALR